MYIVAIYVILCFVVAWCATQKNRSAAGFFILSLVLSPLIGFLVILIVPTLDKEKIAKEKAENKELNRIAWEEIKEDLPFRKKKKKSE
jgi:NADH:ubiquinone oxidoreductase subunit 6 (subunit J)